MNDRRVALVTGANAGVGLATARGLAARGFHVVLWCRDPVRGGRTASEIDAVSSAELVVGDLADPGAIATGVEQVRSRHPRLDVLVNNAGVYAPRRREAPDGLEFTFAVNALAGFRLVHHLRDLLASGGRVISVASRSHAEGRIELDDLQKTRRYDAYRAYADSKLAVVLLTRALGRRLAGTTMAAQSIHPGIVRSEWAQDEPSPLGALFALARPIFRSPERAAETTLWLAEHPDPRALQGAYVVDQQVTRPSRRGRDDAMAERLWARCTELAGPVPRWPDQA